MGTRNWLVCLMIATVALSGAAFAENTDWVSLEDTDSTYVALNEELNPYQATTTQQPDRALWLAQSDGDAEEAAPADSNGGGLSIDVSMAWVSKYMFRGYDVHDDSGAWQPSVELGLGNSGVTLGYWGSYSSHDRGQDLGGLTRRDLDEHNYYAYWGGEICDCIDVEFGFIWYDFIHLNSNSDYWEGYGSFTLSDLPLSPYFAAYYGHPKHSDVGGEGWNTTFGVSHSVPLCGLSCAGDPLALDLAADVWYNGGQYGADTGWSHATFGASTTLPLCAGLEFTPGVYYQVSMEDDINEEDEWWASLSVAYSY